MLISDRYKVSVIVPVYNIEKYIERNIQSLIDQSLNMEIIFVNDGSKDKSVDIIEKYALLDNRIKILHKENGGLSSARNYGLKHSIGEYVIFIDGDDYIEKDSLVVMYNAAKKENLDIVQGCYRRVNDNDQELFGQYNNGLNNTGNAITGINWMLKNHTIPMVWVYLFDRDLLVKNNLTFLECVYHEDVEFTPRALYFSKKINAVDVIFYNYVQREGSIVNSKNIKKFYDIIKVNDSLEDFINKNQISKELKEHFDKNITYNYSQGIHSAILQDIGLDELMKDKQTRHKVIKKTSNSKIFKYKILSVFLKFKAYKLYDMLYKTKIKLKKVQ